MRSCVPAVSPLLALHGPNTETTSEVASYGAMMAEGASRGALFGTQFHPEKSQHWGLRLLENFAAFVRDRRGAA